MKPTTKPANLSKHLTALATWRAELVRWHAKGCPAKKVAPTKVARHIALLAAVARAIEGK